MVKQADVTQVNPGGIIEWTLTIFNSGNAAGQRRAAGYDPVPAGTTYVPGSLVRHCPTPVSSTAIRTG